MRKEQLLEVIAGLREGREDVEIARSMGIPVADVRKAKQEAIESGAFRPVMNFEERRKRRDEIAEYIKENRGKLTRDEVAAHFGLSRSYIEKICKDYGLSDVYKRRQVSNFKILAEWLGGMSAMDIAREHGITCQAVSLVIVTAKNEGLLAAIKRTAKDGGELPEIRQLKKVK